MRLLVFFLIIIVCERYAFAYWVPNGNRSQNCVGQQENLMLSCGDNPFCQYPHRKLKRRRPPTGAVCCCEPAHGYYEKNLTLITAVCGKELHACEDYPYCEGGMEVYIYEFQAKCCCEPPGRFDSIAFGDLETGDDLGFLDETRTDTFGKPFATEKPLFDNIIGLLFPNATTKKPLLDVMEVIGNLG